MSRSSGFSSASAPSSRGSSAMPQIGHAPGPIERDLGMHRADVFARVACDWLRRRGARREVARGLGLEAREAARSTEVVERSLMTGLVFSVPRDAHAADRIERARVRGRRVRARVAHRAFFAVPRAGGSSASAP